MGWVGFWVHTKFLLAMGLVGLGQSFGGLGWVWLKKLDPRTTLQQIDCQCFYYALRLTCISGLFIISVTCGL